MDDVKLKRYQKKLDHSYTLGAEPTMDLLQNRADVAIEVLLHTSGIDREDVKEVIGKCEAAGVSHRYANGEIEKLSSKENTYVVGVFRKFKSKVEQGSDHVLLVNPKDPGNLGTVIRTMVCFDLHNLAIISPAVDHFNPTVLSAAMGSFFRANIEVFESIDEYQATHNNALYTFVLDGDESFDAVEYESPFTLVFGNEGEGLSAESSTLGRRVYIGQSDDFDSLNLSVSAGIAIREATKTKFSK